LALFSSTVLRHHEGTQCCFLSIQNVVGAAAFCTLEISHEVLYLKLCRKNWFHSTFQRPKEPLLPNFECLQSWLPAQNNKNSNGFGANELQKPLLK
jgi:hypothetical protein